MILSDIVNIIYYTNNFRFTETNLVTSSLSYAFSIFYSFFFSIEELSFTIFWVIDLFVRRLIVIDIVFVEIISCLSRS